MSRGGSRRGNNRSECGLRKGADGWSTPAGRPSPNKVGDLSQFGKINKASPGVVNFGPSSVFAGKKGDKRDSASLSRSSSNPFAAFTQNPSENAADVPPTSRSRKPSVDMGKAEPAQMPAETSVRGRGRGGRGRGNRGRGNRGRGRGGRGGQVQPSATETITTSVAETDPDEARAAVDTMTDPLVPQGRVSRPAALRARERLVQMDGVQKAPNAGVLAPKLTAKAQDALLNVLRHDMNEPNIRVVRNSTQGHNTSVSDAVSDAGSEIDFELAPGQSTAISNRTVDQSGDMEMIFDLNMGPPPASDIEDPYELDVEGPDSDEEVLPPPRRKTKRPVAVSQAANITQPVSRARVVPSGPRPLTVQLLVPNYASTKKTLELTSATYVKAENPDLGVARKTIKKAFGATEDDDVVLEYKMYRSEPLRHPLVTPEDWSRWLDNVEKYEKKKKFLETISIFFFSSTLEERAAAAKGSKTGVESLGLSGVTQENKEWYRQLKEHLEANPCGRPACKDRFCKIDVFGKHGLSLQEYQAWADALPKGVDGATLNRPPRNVMFKRYHRDLLDLPDADRLPRNARGSREHMQEPSLPASTNPLPVPSHYFQNFDRILQGATPMTLHAPAPGRIISKVRGPKIPDFLAEMQENEGNMRNYIKYADAFQKHELCFIGELSEWTLAQFQERIEMPIGPAQMVLQGIADKLAQLSLAGMCYLMSVQDQV
ncbi:hypothetical protein EXIGLDRAFT_779779 [Exidia glandulosa HHB12029]|uniref:Uncharacterized protein n=1 Tax=Exidia glandulosa HHB12029 TaxID=1314781 RepID=A0A165BWM1_EXIGL|nr:hypothetical protein EXIGLDRAFT_779779 [Exidia glandulosa HHB12029]